MNEKMIKTILLTLYTLLVACMGYATVIEKVEGKDCAYDSIYGTWWFIALWALLTVVSVGLLIRKKVYKRCAVFVLHISLCIMLVGALITHLTAVSGTVHLRKGMEVCSFTDEDGLVHDLPFVLILESFGMQYYPGTDAVMDYTCSITVREEVRTDTMRVSMNNIGKVSGYRFYQSAYDSDSQGSQLLVAYDPYGIAVTYMGYVMLLVSLLWTLFSRHTRLRELYRKATKPAAAVMLLCLSSVSAWGADMSVTPVSAEIAHDFGKVVVLYNGRLCPVNTAAQEFVTKLSGKPSWNGLSADEIFMGWMIYYTEWEEQKIIRVKSQEVQRLLGIDGKWASVSDFYTADHRYKLSGKVLDDTLPDAVRKAVREADEKIQVVTMFYNSEMLRMFPLPTGKDGDKVHALTWHTPGSTELPLGVETAEFQFINHAMDYLVQSILVNDADEARKMISKIRLYQREKAGDVLPAPMMVDMEVTYNKLLAARWVVFAYLALSLLSCLYCLRCNSVLGRVGERVYSVVFGMVLLFMTMLLVLRWMVSGHVPMSNGYETMLFMAWVTLLISFALMRKVPVMKAFGPVVSSLCMLVSMIAVGSPQITQLMPVLQSPLLSVHVALVMIAYALLAIITLIAANSLVRYRSWQQEDYLSQLLLYPAVACLAIGIFVGAVWANVSWGTYWSWDPKETWALITLMIYAVPLHRSFMPTSARAYNWYILLSFLAVLMTYFGVNYFLTGMHSYA